MPRWLSQSIRRGRITISQVGFLAARQIEIGMTKTPPKAKETRSFGPKSFLARAVFLPEFSISWPQSQLLGGKSITSILDGWEPCWGTYTSMPHPLFGAKDVCCIEKKRPHFILAGTLQGTISPTPPALNGHAKKKCGGCGVAVVVYPCFQSSRGRYG